MPQPVPPTVKVTRLKSADCRLQTSFLVHVLMLKEPEVKLMTSRNVIQTHKQVLCNFKVCKSVHHHTIQPNQPYRCKNFSSLLLDVYVQLNTFRASSCPSSGATAAVAASDLPRSLVIAVLFVVVAPAGPTTTNSTAITKLRRQTRGCYCSCCSS